MEKTSASSGLVPGTEPSEIQSESALGRRVREMRKAKGCKLADLAARTGLAVSTISKMERGEISLTYDRFIRLAQGLGLDVGELFDPGAESFASGSVSVTRARMAPVHETPTYYYEMLNSDLTGKHMVPMIGMVHAHSIAEFSAFISHPGEEFVHIIAGSIELHISGREPVRLEAGDSMYFDSGMGHAYVSAGAEDARILVVCWKPGKP